MWARAIYFGGGVISNKILAGYRVFEGNDTSKLAKSAENLNDFIRLKQKFVHKFPHFKSKLYIKNLYGKAFDQYERFLSLKDISSAANTKYFIFFKLPFFYKLKFLKFITIKKLKKSFEI
jgi:hypothetical protein